MATWIKAGFWEKLCKPCQGYKGWLNLDQFVQDNARPYKVYTALLTQSGTSAPVATILENTLGGDITFQYLSPGNYKITLPSSVSGKMWISVTQNNNNDSGYIMYDMDNVGNPNINNFFLLTYSIDTGSPASFTFSNDVLYGTSIEIRVYN